MSDNYGTADSWKNITGELAGLMETEEGLWRILRGAIALHNHPHTPEKVFIQVCHQPRHL